MPVLCSDLLQTTHLLLLKNSRSVPLDKPGETEEVFLFHFLISFHNYIITFITTHLSFFFFQNYNYKEKKSQLNRWKKCNG